MEFRRENINEIAKQITHNSDLFGDEVEAVIGQLTSLMNSAEEFGCVMESTVNNYWGDSVKVKAIPNTIKTEWSF